MPSVKYYEVTETREVRVSATTPQDAAIIADAAFYGKPYPAELGSTTSEVVVTNFDIRKEL